MATVTLAQLESIMGPSGVLAYWDADDLIGLGQGGAVNTWTDQKNGLVLTPTAAAPSLDLNYNSLGFAAVDTAGELSMEVTDALLGREISVLVAFTDKTAPGNADTIWSNGNTTTSLQRLRTLAVQAQYTFQHSNTGQNLTSTMSDGEAGAVKVIAGDFAQATAPDWDRTQIIGLAGAQSFASAGFHNGHVISNNFYLGRRPVDASQKYEGGYFAVVILDKAEANFYQLLATSSFFQTEFGLEQFDVEPNLPTGGGGGITPHELQTSAHVVGGG